MKKTSKALSFILTLCMIASLFAGLGISGTASAANGLTDTVLTIDSAASAHGTGWDWDGSILFGGLTVNGGSATVSCGTADKAYAIVSADYEETTAGTLTTTGTVKSGDVAPGIANSTNFDSGAAITDKYVSVSFKSATISDFTTIEGVKGHSISDTPVTITLSGDTFDVIGSEEVFNTNVGGIFVRMELASSGDTTATGTIYGSPTEACNKSLTITIPSGKLTGGSEIITTANSSAMIKIKTNTTLERTTPADFSTGSITYKDEYGTEKTAAVSGNITDSGEGWKWYAMASDLYDNAATITADNHPANTLILNGANIDIPSEATNPTQAINLPASATVVVSGTNNVLNKAVANRSGIKANGDLTFAGDGTLNIEAKAAGINNSIGNTEFKSGTYTVSSSNGTGIFASGKTVTVTGGTLTASGDAKAINGTLSTTGTVKAGDDNTGTDTSYTDKKWVNVSFGPIFDARNGETVEDYAAYAASTTWVSGDNTYTFGGWYDGIDGTGDLLDGTPADGTTYYAKWISGDKTVRTQPLDFTAYNESTNPTGFDAEHTHGAKVFQGMYMNSDEGWIWYPSEMEPSLSLQGAVIDCSNVTDCYYAVRLPAGANIDLVSGTESTVKGGEGIQNVYNYASCALYSSGAASLIGNGTLNAYSKNIENGAYEQVISAPIYIGGGLAIGKTNNRPTVNATAGTAKNTNNAQNATASSCGAFAIALKSGAVTAKGNTATSTATESSFGTLMATMTGGSLRATGNTAAVGQLSATGAVATGSADYNASDPLDKAFYTSYMDGGDEVVNIFTTETPADATTVVKTAHITIPPSISVSEQSGTLTYGTAVTGSVQFTVTANSFNTPAYSGEIEWVTAEHDGITLALVGNNVKVTTTAAANAGSYEFKVKSGTVSSAAVTLSIGKATYSPAPSKTIGVRINQSTAPSGTLTASDFFTSVPAGAKITEITPTTAGGVVSTTPTLNDGTLSWTAVESLASTDAADSVYSVTITSTNYNITATLTFDAVDKTPVTVSGVAVAGKTYDGAAAVKTGTPKAVLTSDSTTDKTSNIDSWTYLYESTDTGSYSSADAPTNAGAYKLTVTADDADFDGKQVIAFTISPKEITVKPNAKSITKGATMPTFDLDVSGVIAADRAEDEFQELLSACAFAAQVSDSDPTAITSTATAGSYIVRWTNMSAVEAGASDWPDYANYTVTWEDTAAFTITTPAPVAPAVSDDGAVIVDGKTEKIGTVKTDGDNKTVEVDSEKLSEKLAAADKGSSVIVTVPETKASANAELVVKSLEDMAKKEMVLEVKVGGVSYELETTAIDTKAITAQLGANDTAAIPVKVSITPLAQGSVAVTDATVVANPVKFEITASYGGKSVTVDTFGSYVSRFIEITEAQAKTITTAIVKEADGSQRHVPTEVYTQGGKWFAKINSRTNSTYVLIHSEQSFADASGKWFEAVVSEMASRKVINGRDATTFDGDGNITRAEFAAIAVRALGLPADGDCTFTDVAKGAWYYGAVGTAAQYGLISGRTAETFDPEAPITREEAMQLIYNAAKVAEYTGKTGELTGFKDAESVASWAQAAAQFNVGSGLIVGSDGKLNPTANITRAETATVVLRLLQNAGLIDIRTKA